MLTIYKTTEQGLEQLDSMANGAWVKAVDPTPEEIQQLVTWGIDADYINYSLDLDEMPRMERDEDYTFILIRIPHRQPESDIPYITIPLGIMIKGNIIVTICRYDKEMFKVLANGNIVYSRPASAIALRCISSSRPPLAISRICARSTA